MKIQVELDTMETSCSYSKKLTNETIQSHIKLWNSASHIILDYKMTLIQLLEHSSSSQLDPSKLELFEKTNVDQIQQFTTWEN